MKAHMIFDINMGTGFTSKAMFISRGHKIYNPTSIMYGSLVSRDILQIVMIMEALNDHNVKCADI